MRDSLYDWYWKMPELRAIISGMVADVFGEGYGLDGDKARQAKTNRFLRQNCFNRYGKSVLRDALISGDGYLGKASLTESQVLEAMDVIYADVFHKSVSPPTQHSLLQKIVNAKPDIYSPKVLFPLMSRSIYINYDAHGKITGYTQRPRNSSTAFTVSPNGQGNIDVPSSYAYGTMGSNQYGVQFLPEEVIHFPYEPVGDQIYGNSPMQTAIYDVASLWYAKTYGGLFFQNDATPSYIFNLPDDSPDSQNYKKFVEAIKEHRQNPHRNMVITGNVGINKVASLSKDLEFSNFIDKFTQRVMLAYGATARFSHLFGVNQTPPSMESYYKQINSIQTEYEDTLNNELFDNFGVDFYFNRVYKRDETREADIAVKLTNLCWTVNEAREYLGFKPIPNPMFDELTPQQQDEFVDGKRKKKEEVASADARTEQNAVSMTSRQQMKGDTPVNGDEND
jgi:HK97 family phage portal protein